MIRTTPVCGVYRVSPKTHNNACAIFIIILGFARGVCRRVPDVAHVMTGSTVRKRTRIKLSAPIDIWPARTHDLQKRFATTRVRRGRAGARPHRLRPPERRCRGRPGATLCAGQGHVTTAHRRRVMYTIVGNVRFLKIIVCLSPPSGRITFFFLVLHFRRR